MSKEVKLTAAQVHELEPFERHFRQAIEAAWCSYPGQAGINKMLDIWLAIAGSQYPYKPGCPNCLLNLVRDLGTLYFAQKDSVLAEETAAKVAETAQKPATEKKGRKTTAKGKKSVKTK